MPDKATHQASRAQRDKELFEQIATGYAAKDLNRSAQVARRYRLHETLKEASLTPAHRILEVGCGAGYSADYLAGHFGQYVGIDYSNELIANAQDRWRHQQGNVRFDAASISEFKSDEPFDLIFMIGVLHHVEHPADALRELLHQLKPGSAIYCNEPSGLNPFIQLLRWVRTQFDSTYSAEQLTYRPQDLEQLFEQAGFENVRVRWQGLLSTPFAEVPCRPQWLFMKIAQLACRVDRALAKRCSFLLPLAWNLIVTANRPS